MPAGPARAPAAGLRCASLGSGSRGNATLVCSATTAVLLDCGFSVAELSRRMRRIGLDPDCIDAIVVTHEHGDHVRGVGPLARATGAPVYMSAGTRRACGWDGEARTVVPLEPFTSGDIELLPFPVPHDAAEPVQYVFRHAGLRLGVVSDLGRPTPCVVEALRGCHGLMLEANHDPDMLARGPYPETLRQRVGGPFGHLSNRQAAELLEQVAGTQLQFLVLTHISEKNNLPRLAAEACRKPGLPEPLVACQTRGTPWLTLAL